MKGIRHCTGHGAEPADSLPVFGLPALNRGSAASFSPHRAMLKACGEAVERYCSSYYRSEQLIFGAYNSLRDVAVDPFLFPIPFQSKDSLRDGFEVLRTSEIYWCPAVSWSNKSLRLVPAEFVYVPFQPKGYRSLSDGISTGLSCHTSFDLAAIGAVLEVIERDAFMLFWYLGSISEYIDLDSISDLGSVVIVDHLHRAGYELYVADISQNSLCPVILCIAFHQSPGFPRATVGLGTDFNTDTAVRKALEEISLGVLGMRKLLTKRQVEYPRTFNTLDDHGFWYAADPELTVNIRRKLEHSRGVPLSDISSKYARIDNCGLSATWLSDVSLQLGDIYFCDVTTRDIAEIGLSVVRAVVPGAQPLDINHEKRAVFHTRVREVREQRGLSEPLSSTNPIRFHRFARVT
jgi:ribosomal protein S12 methylthiotransferase accessory factor